MLMKRTITLLLLSAALLSVAALSCTPAKDAEVPAPDEQKEEEKEKEEGKEEVKETVVKFVASPLQGTWKAGDQIYVHGSLGSMSEVVTLTADDISADGKTATGKLTLATQYPTNPDQLYAGWPDQAVKHIQKKIGNKTSFEVVEGLITAAYLNGDTFSFIDVASFITFTVTGDYDKYALGAADRDGVIITTFEVEYTSAKTNLVQAKNNGYPFKYGTLESGKEVTIWMPAGLTFKGGLVLYLGKGEDWTATYTKTGNVTLERGVATALGDISSDLTPYDGPAPKMPEMTGEKKKMTVKVAEVSGVCIADEEHLWVVGDEGDLAKLALNGTVEYTYHIGGDSEDVSPYPDSENGDLLIGLEPSGVGLVKGPNYNSRYTTLFNIAACSGYGNSGIEGLAYYKDGKVFAGAQSNSHLFLCNLSSKAVEWELKMYNPQLVSEVAGLCYDPLTGWLWIIDSEAKKVFVFDAAKLLDTKDISASLLGAYPVSDGGNPESVCVDHKHNCIWVADDYGDTSYLYQYEVLGLDDFNMAQ